MKVRKLNNKGLTLVEILVGIAILGIMLSSLLAIFINTGRANDASAVKQKGNELALSVMEAVKTMNAEEVKEAFKGAAKSPQEGKFLSSLPYPIAGASVPDLEDGTLTEKGGENAADAVIDTLRGKLTGVKNGKYRYDIEVTMDGSYYRSDVGTGETSESGMNDYKMPELINMDSNNVALVDYAGKIEIIDELALNELIAQVYGKRYSEYQEECDKLKPGQEKPPEPEKPSKEEIGKLTQKTITMKVGKADGVYESEQIRYCLTIAINYFYVFTDDFISYDSENVIELYYDGTQLENIYFLFRENYDWSSVWFMSNLDNIERKETADGYSFYIVGQEPLSSESGGKNASEQKIDSLDIKDGSGADMQYRVYSNFKIASNKTIVDDRIVKKEDTARNRIYRIQITVFKAGTDEAVCTLDSSN